MALVKYIVFHPWRATTVLIMGILLGSFAFYLYEVGAALGAVATESFAPAEARAAIETPPVGVTTTTLGEIEVILPAYGLDIDPLEQIEPTSSEPLDPREIHPNSLGDPISDDVFDSYLLIGSDASGYLADAIILALQPTRGGAPIMVSLPRDLWVWNLCKGTFTRLNEGLGGCKGGASGSELIAIMVEDYTGIPVDHLARVNFGGFSNLVDVMGGIRVCVDYPSRDIKAHLEIPEPGCQVVDGDTALGWVRSRHMEQLRDEEWVSVGGSDFGRQRRQQDVLFQLAGRAAGFSSPTSLAKRLSAVSKSIRLDSGWTLGQAVAAGWRYRGIKRGDVNRFSIEVTDHRTSRGQAVLLPVVPFQEQLDDIYTWK